MAYLTEQNVTQALKLTTNQDTKKLVLSGVKGNDDFPGLLKDYKWTTAKPYDMALIITAYYAYCIKSQDSSLKNFGKTAKSQSNDSFKLLNYLLEGNDAKVKSLIKKCFPTPMNKILEMVISGESEREKIIDNFVKQAEKFKSSDFDERKKVCVENMIYILTDQELKQVAKDFTNNKEAAKNAANIVLLKKQLTTALQLNNLKTVQQIIKSNPNLVNANLPPYGRTPLLIAMDKHDWEMVDFLIQHSNPNIQDEKGRTPLRYIIMYMYNNKKGVELLLQHGADPNIQDNNNETPLHWAVRNGHRETVKLLLQHRANPNIQSIFRETPLYIAVSKGYQEIVDLLLQHGADPNIQDILHGETLHIAVRNGHREIVDLLLQHGANPNIQDILHGETPLLVAVSKGYREIVNLLLQHRADPDIHNYRRETPLLVAVSKGYREIVNLLLQHRANPNKHDAFRQTPLHFAVSKGDREIVNLLLQHDADPNIHNCRRETPLHFAALCQYREIVELLLQHRANPNLRTSNGLTYLDIWPHAPGSQLRHLRVEDFPQEEFRRSFAKEETKQCPSCLEEFPAKDLCCIFNCDCKKTSDYRFGHYLCNECAQALLDNQGEDTLCPVCFKRLKPHN